MLGSATEIRTERLRLRAPRRGDLHALDEAIRETLDELVSWLPWAHAAHGRGDTRSYLRNARLARAQRSAFEFVVEEATGRELLGIVSVHRIDWTRGCGGIGYWVRRSSWGKQVATEAARALVEHSFRTLGLRRLEAQVAPGNAASQRVVEKLGFRREGVAREFEFVNGRYLDHVQYSLLRREVIGPTTDERSAT
jgi:ribosomal-protein-serine acetyltransferase